MDLNRYRLCDTQRCRCVTAQGFLCPNCLRFTRVLSGESRFRRRLLRLCCALCACSAGSGCNQYTILRRQQSRACVRAAKRSYLSQCSCNLHIRGVRVVESRLSLFVAWESPVVAVHWSRVSLIGLFGHSSSHARRVSMCRSQCQSDPWESWLWRRREASSSRFLRNSCQCKSRRRVALRPNERGDRRFAHRGFDVRIGLQSAKRV